MAVTRTTLHAARDHGKPVRLRRTGVLRRTGALQVSGVVLEVGRQWCAVQTLTGQVMLLRNADIGKLTRTEEPRADKADRRHARDRVAMLDLTDVRTVLFTAGSLAPVLDLRCEKRRRVVVGNVVRIGGKRVQVLPRRAEGWAPEPVLLRLTHLTRVVLP